VSKTLHELLAATRAHVGFALRTGGEQALANVLHVAELARQYEATGGISFRGFVDELRAAAETARVAEAPILEEDSDGVRIMTVHKAKGLEFPIVILADMTCKLSRPEAGRWIDPTGDLCALKLGGWTPTDLRLHGGEEVERDRAEGVRLAYVAATRARDVLVVPAIGDEPYDGWLEPMNRAIYPALSARRQPLVSIGCPAFPSRDSVLNRPDGDPASPSTVAPGCFELARLSDPSDTDGTGTRPHKTYSVTWWDPHVLALDARSTLGLRRDDLIAKDGDPRDVESRLATYQSWLADRAAVVKKAGLPSIETRTVTDAAGDRTAAAVGQVVPIDVVDVSRLPGRPFGPVFGTLVHAILATAALDADERTLKHIGTTQARILRASAEDIDAAVEVVLAVQSHPLFDQVREADARGQCHRELPIIWRSPDGSLLEGTIDLAFEHAGVLTVLDFKTDKELDTDLDRYRRQLMIYCEALSSLRSGEVRGVLMRV
jgi:ATP-dependent exoDNAse (exonuclease V) beta subunit